MNPSIATDLTEIGPGFASVAINANDWSVKLSAPGDIANELSARIAAGEIQSTAVTAEIAADVLGDRGAAGGRLPEPFIRRLIGAIELADRENILRLGAIYPGYVLAVDWARNGEGGLAALQVIAGQVVLNPDPAPAPERVVRHGRC